MLCLYNPIGNQSQGRVLETRVGHVGRGQRRWAAAGLRRLSGRSATHDRNCRKTATKSAATAVFGIVLWRKVIHLQRSLRSGQGGRRPAVHRHELPASQVRRRDDDAVPGPGEDRGQPTNGGGWDVGRGQREPGPDEGGIARVFGQGPGEIGLARWGSHDGAIGEGRGGGGTGQGIRLLRPGWEETSIDSKSAIPAAEFRIQANRK
mmetsp:Transcript_28956/g.61473  ORF Transcript_28956/g.61473 Transcript_28956/m.61473 type:complete len:206 (+) Transcript_28956:537-1154(+)